MFIGIELKINWQFWVYIKVYLNHPASSLKFLWFRMHNSTNAYQYTSNQPPSHQKKKNFINTFILLLFLFGYLTYIHILFFSLRIFL